MDTEIIHIIERLINESTETDAKNLLNKLKILGISPILSYSEEQLKHKCINFTSKHYYDTEIKIDFIGTLTIPYSLTFNVDDKFKLIQ